MDRKWVPDIETALPTIFQANITITLTWIVAGPLMEAGWNTSIICLRTIGDDMGTKCRGVHTPRVPALAGWFGLEYGTLKHGHESCGARTSE
jgi:hypothetical protein